MASELGAGVKQPTLVTHIEHNGERKRVKLVFHHHHFNNPQDLQALTLAERVKAPTLMEPGEIMAAESLPKVVSTIICPGGTKRFWPRGVTVAKLVEWPLLSGEVRQGDGHRLALDEVIATGYAVCAEMDNYEKAVGRHLALKNLLETSALLGAARHAVALCYAHRNGVKKKKAKKLTFKEALVAALPLAVENLDPGDELPA